MQIVKEREGIADAIQVYTNDSRIHLFTHFYENKAEEVINLLDHAWRACKLPQTFPPQIPGEPPHTPFDKTVVKEIRNVHVPLTEGYEGQVPIEAHNYDVLASVPPPPPPPPNPSTVNKDQADKGLQQGAGEYSVQVTEYIEGSDVDMDFPKY